MKFANRRLIREYREVGHLRTLLCLLIALIPPLASCAHSALGVKMDSSAVARSLGLKGCRVSIPLTQVEVIEQAKRDGDPDPESHPEWIRMRREFRDGDQFRLVNCVRTDKSGVAGGAYYFALFRNDVAISEMHNIIVN